MSQASDWVAKLPLYYLFPKSLHKQQSLFVGLTFLLVRPFQAHFIMLNILVCLLLFYSNLSYAYKDDIGYTKLGTELGINLSDGSGVLVSQTEADTDGVDGSPYNYFPDTTNAQLLGKTIIDVTNSSNQPSSHATGTGRLFYGTNSIASGITNIYVYEVNNWLQADYLRLGYTTKPLSSPSRIGNHSWIGSSDYDSDILRRLDWIIETDEFVQFVGTRNSSGLNFNLLSAAYPMECMVRVLAKLIQFMYRVERVLK